LEYAVNELGQPVIYIINYVYVEHNVRQKSFEVATATLEEAEGIVGGRPCFEILEQNMLTREQAPIHMIRKQQEEKDLLLSLYKSGFKRQTFEKLDVRKPFQEQVNFPLAPELVKAERLAGTVASL
jgi:hypothetical protein